VEKGSDFWKGGNLSHGGGGDKKGGGEQCPLGEYMGIKNKKGFLQHGIR